MIAPLLGGVVLAKAGYNAVFGMTIGIIGVDIVLRLLLIEKMTAMTWLEKPEDEPHKEKQQSDLEHNTRGQVVEQKECDVHIQPVNARAGRRMKLPAVLRLLSSRRLCVALWASFAIGTIFAGLETVLPIHTAGIWVGLGRSRSDISSAHVTFLSGSSGGANMRQIWL